MQDNPRIFEPAVFSPCRRWRYTLFRDMRPPLFAEPMRAAQFLCLNPSTADETRNDPTVARCVQFANDWGMNAMWMTNLFAFRATDPGKMLAEPDPVGLDNSDWILRVARAAEVVVCAWGNHGRHMRRSEHVLSLLRGAGLGGKLRKLRLNSNGEPCHPLYLPGSLWPTMMPEERKTTT